MKNVLFVLFLLIFILVSNAQVEEDQIKEEENYKKAGELFREFMDMINDSLMDEAEKKIIELAPESEYALYLYVWDYYYEKDNDEMAIKLVDELISKYPEFAPGYFAKGSLINNTSTDYNKASEQFLKAISLDPEFSYAYRNLGITYFNLDKFQEAEKQFAKADELHKDGILNMQFRGMNYYMLDEYEKAYAVLSKVKDEDVFISDFYYYYGNTLDVMERDADALIAFSKGIVMDPESPDLLFGHGWAKYMLGHLKDALYDFKASIILDSSFVDGYYGCGLVYTEMGKYDEALFYLNEVINLDSEYPEAYFYRGGVYFEQKEYEKAIKDLDVAVQTEPKDAYCYYFRGSAKLSVSNEELYDDGKEDLEKAIELGNADEEVYLQIAEIMEERLADTDFAMKALKLSIEMDPEYDEALYYMGYLYDGDDMDRACEYYEKAAELGHKQAAKMLKKVCK